MKHLARQKVLYSEAESTRAVVPAHSSSAPALRPTKGGVDDKNDDDDDYESDELESDDSSDWESEASSPTAGSVEGSITRIVLDPSIATPWRMPGWKQACRGEKGANAHKAAFNIQGGQAKSQGKLHEKGGEE